MGKRIQKAIKMLYKCNKNVLKMLQKRYKNVIKML